MNSFFAGFASGAPRGALPVSPYFVAIFVANSKEKEHMEKELTTPSGTPVPQTNEGRCPVAHGTRAFTNADWWPGQRPNEVRRSQNPDALPASWAPHD